MMGTLSLSLTGFTSANPVPGTYLEVKFAQGDLLGNPAVPKVLFIGPKTSSGSATAGTQVYAIGSAQDAIDYFGTGSPIHRMYKRFSEVCKSALCYGIAPAESAGVQASDTVTFVGSASGTGVVTYTLCGETIQVAVANGDSVTTIASALSAAINLQTHWPVTASPLVGVVTVTARIKGTNGNMIRHRVSITSGITTTAACAASLLASGATDESYTTTLATILPDKYDYIVPGVNPGTAATSETRISDLETQNTTQALPTTGFRQQVIVSHVGTEANAKQFVANATGPSSSPRFSCIWQETSEWEPMELAAHVAGVRYNEETGADPGVNYDGYGLGVNDIWNVPKQYSNADYATSTELSAALSEGLTPIAVASNGKTYIVRMVTCSLDVRVRDTSKVTVADRFASDLAARYNSQWTRAKVQDDLATENVQPPSNVATPDRVKGMTIAPLMIQYAKDGLLDSAKVFNTTNGDLLAIACGIDPVVPTRINARIPLHVTPLLHQFAALISEVSSG